MKNEFNMYFEMVFFQRSLGTTETGDISYPCSHYLLTPLLTPRMQADRAYNTAHRRTLQTKLENMYATIVAVAVLHNISIIHHEEDFLEDLQAADFEVHREIPPVWLPY